MSSDVGMFVVANVRLLVRLICRSDPVGTVITTGDHPVAFGFAPAQLAAEPVTTVPQLYPHIGTDEPSGNVMVEDAAVRLICCCATEALIQRSSIIAARIAVLTGLIELSSIALFLT